MTLRLPKTLLRSAALSALILAGSALHGEATDLASERLLGIALKEEQIYKRIAEDPDFYTGADLDRRINELVQSYRSYLTDHPNDVDALVLYGKLLRRVEMNEQAFRAFLKADQLDPTMAVVKQQLGTHLAEEGKGKAALTFYLQAVELEPETAMYHYAVGQLLNEFRDEFLEDNMFTADTLDREMLQGFRTAAKLEPDNFDLHMRLGEAYYDLNIADWQTALGHWEKLLEAQEQPMRRDIVSLHKARVLGKLGRAAEARETLDTVEHPALQFSRQQVLDELAQH